MEIEKVEIKQEGTHFQDTLMLNSDMCNDSSPKKQELVDPTDDFGEEKIDSFVDLCEPKRQ